MPDKEGSDDEKKSTKSVVNKKQKQMLNQEEYATEMVRKIVKKISGRAVYPTAAQNKVRGEIIKGDDLKIDNKNPIKKKLQKNNLDEEGYDVARDEGRVRPSKDKKDATTMPVSDEMKKTQKKNKGPSALELVKAKYGKAVMDVKKEELDLTKVAEAFGGHIIEARKSKGGGAGTGSNGEIPQSVQNVRQGIKDLDATQPIRDAKGNIIVNPPDDTTKTISNKKEKVKSDYYSKPDSIKKGEQIVNQGEFSTRTGIVGRGGVEVTSGKGDGRKAGRRGRTVTYTTGTSQTKPKVTTVMDFGRKTDTRSSVDPKPTVQPKPTETKRQKNTRTRKDAEQVIQDVRSGKLKVKGFVGDKEPKVSDLKVDKKTLQKNLNQKRFARIRRGASIRARKGLRFIKRNPLTTAIGVGVGKDTFFPPKIGLPPMPKGGKVGKRTAG